MNDEMKENENKCIVINNDLQVSVHDANSPINLSSIQPNLPVGINTLINEETNSESETAGIILSNEGANTVDDISNENLRTETADINSYNENVGNETADNDLSNENSRTETADINSYNENVGNETADNDLSNKNSRTETADINSYNGNVGNETADNDLSNKSKVQTSIVKIQANDSTCSMLSEPGTNT